MILLRRRRRSGLLLGLVSAFAALSAGDAAAKFNFGMPAAAHEQAKALDSRVEQVQAQNSYAPAASAAPGYVFITGPSGQHVYTVQSSSISLRGASYHLGGLRWANSRGGSGAIVAGDTWTASNVPLQVLDNAITVFGTDYSGIVSTDSITITYNPNLNFSSYAQADPDAFFVNESTNVAFSISIDTSSGQLVAGSVKVHQVDANDKIIDAAPFPVALVDDGFSTFTAVVGLTEPSTGTLRFRISADTGNGSGAVTAYSEVFTLSVFAHVTATQYTAASDSLDQLDQQYSAFKTANGTAAAQTKALAWLQAQPNIVVAGVLASGNGLWYVLDSGIPGILLDAPAGTQAGGTALSSAPHSAGAAAAGSPPPRPRRFKPRSAGSGSQNLIGSKQATILNAFIPDKGIASILETAGLQVNPVSSAQTLDYIELGGNGVVFVNTHGGVLSKYNAVFAHTPAACVANFLGSVAFLTEELVGPTPYSGGIDYRQCTLAQAKISNSSPHYLAVTPAFIRKYNGGFANSIVYASACESLTNATMAQAFLGLGAATYFGYTADVNVSFAQARESSVFELLSNPQPLVDGVSTGDAFAANSSQQDGAPGHGYLLRAGSQNTYMVETYTVALAGIAGGGSVTSSPAGINCPGTCTAAFAPQTPVTLTATPGGSGSFTGWSGGGCSGTGTCSVQIAAAQTVTATFSQGYQADYSCTVTNISNCSLVSDPDGPDSDDSSPPTVGLLYPNPITGTLTGLQANCTDAQAQATTACSGTASVSPDGDDFWNCSVQISSPIQITNCQAQ